jgi:putative oxidoreductase
MTQLSSSSAALEPHPPIPLTADGTTPRARLRGHLRTTSALTPVLLRVGLGGVIFAHGLQKAFGWFGGYGIDGTMKFFASLGMPSVLGALVIVSDFFGSLGLLLGLLTRFSAAAAFAVMLGAVALLHWPNGFFMNWAGAPHGEGYEFHLLAMAMAASLMLSGGGRYSLDGWLARKL